MDDSGQISTEVLVVMAAVLAVALLFASHLASTSSRYGKSITQSNSKIGKTISKIGGR